jgi:hypothetical protein
MGIKISKLYEKGMNEALFGLGFSHGLTSDLTFDEFIRNKQLYERMRVIASKLSFKGNGESKFLESIVVCFDIEAPIYFWSEFDTYRVGTTKQSTSTMHTLLKDGFDFENNIEKVNNRIADEMLKEKIADYFLMAHSIIQDVKLDDNIDIATKKTIAKSILPSSFNQRRIVVTNYKVLQNMYAQRHNHQLQEWKDFCKFISSDEIYKPDWICER